MDYFCSKHPGKIVTVILILSDFSIIVSKTITYFVVMKKNL